MSAPDFPQPQAPSKTAQKSLLHHKKRQTLCFYHEYGVTLPHEKKETKTLYHTYNHGKESSSYDS